MSAAFLSRLGLPGFRAEGSTVISPSVTVSPETLTSPQVPAGSTLPGSEVRAEARAEAAVVSPTETRKETVVSCGCQGEVGWGEVRWDECVGLGL